MQCTCFFFRLWYVLLGVAVLYQVHHQWGCDRAVNGHLSKIKYPISNITAAITAPIEEHSPPQQQEAKQSHCDQSVQVDTRSKLAHTAKKSKRRRKERDLKSQILLLQITVNKYKLELKKIQEDSLTADLSYIKKKSCRKASYSIIFDRSNFELQEEETVVVRRI